MLELNLRPTYLVTQSALPRLVAAGGGAIVCVSSKAAFEPWAGGSGYAASKAAVAAFARAVAKEHADEGVRCNVIAPTMIDTPANRAANPNAKMTPPEQVASLIRFLCSDESARVERRGAAVLRASNCGWVGRLGSSRRSAGPGDFAGHRPVKAPRATRTRPKLAASLPSRS